MPAYYQDDIAIIGIGCRFPGGANDVESYWRILAEGRCAWSEVPKSRFNWQAFHHPRAVDGNIPATNHRGGHFLNVDISKFDAGFFGISAQEAAVLDPQHRLQLETAYEAIENAGIPLDTLKGSKTGVYMAILFRDWDRMMWKDPSDISPYHVTGTGEALLSNRISYTFDLRGPAFTVDTGCSGSVVALNQACMSLRSGETNMALVGGTNMILSPDQMIPMSYMGFCNANGRSYSFDDRGSGYGRGEGAATLVLKRLNDAISAGDPIRSIIKHSAINQDGRTIGITTPNQSAQEDLARSLLDASHIDPASIDFIEAHGTGTQVGDLSELRAVANVFCHGRRNHPLVIGSCKANIGHLEAASGIAGIVKCVLALERGELPPQPDFEVPKDGLHLDQWSLEIPRRKQPWPHLGTRRAIVNSFGYGGTNGMVVLESVPAWLQSPRTVTQLPMQNDVRYQSIEPVSRDLDCEDSLHEEQDTLSTPNVYLHLPETIGDSGSMPSSEASSSPTSLCSSVSGKDEIRETYNPCYLFFLSAKSQASLAQYKYHMKRWLQLQKRRPCLLGDLAFTLGTRRTRHPYRQCFAASSKEEVIAALDEETDAISTTAISRHITFVFTGQGAQWHAMGRELLFHETGFARSIRISDRMLKTFGADWSLIQELTRSKETSRIHQADIGQPACTAIQIAVVDLLQQWRVAPNSVVGHSSGEIAAAYAVGALSHEDALRVSFHRGSLSRLSRSRLGNTNGSMLAIGVSEPEAAELVANLKAGRVVIACANSPSSTTLSGDEPAIDEARAILESKSIFARKLRVDTAYHSHHMEAVSSDYVKLIQQIKERKPLADIRYISSVTAEEKCTGFGPQYWAENLVSRVRFADAIQALAQGKVAKDRHLFVEIGPHSVLGVPLHDILQDRCLSPSFNFHYMASLVRGKHAASTLLGTAASLCASGVDVNLRNVNAISDGRSRPDVITNLVPYSWDHSTSYWHEPRISRDYRLRSHAHHELLGVRDVSTPPYVPSWRSFISKQTLPWLQDHVVQGLEIFPGAGFICMVLEAARQLIDCPRSLTGFRIRRVEFLEALMLNYDHSQRVEMHTNLRLQAHATNPRYEFVVSSCGSDCTWQQHCIGTIEPILASNPFEHDTKEQLTIARVKCTRPVNGDELYAQLRKNGNNYGNAFALLNGIYLGENIGIGSTNKVRSNLSSADFSVPYTIHPTLLDAIFHSVMPLQSNTLPRESCLVLQSIDDMTLSCIDGINLHELTLLAQAPSVSASRIGYDVLAVHEQLDGETVTVAEVSGILFHHTVPRPSDKMVQSSTNSVYELRWDEDIDLTPGRTLESLVATSAEALSEYSLHKEGCFAEASIFYVRRCLQQLQARKFKLAHPHYEYLVAWMQRFMHNALADEHLATLDSGDPERFKHLSQLGVLGEALKRNGDSLFDILLGNIDPLAHLLEDDLLYRLYNEDSFRACNEYLRSFLAPLIFKDPNMKVLEIGAGTGSTTIPLFNQLSPNGERIFGRYDFTDISPGFFENGREKLSSWREMISFRVFDLDVDAGKQGFHEGDYDLIIAANVVHATRNINNTLRSVKKLLKPAGKLMLIEIIDSVPMLNIMFGVLEGWWAGIDEGRTDTPLRSVDQWRDHFSECGFRHSQTATNDFHALMVAEVITQCPQQQSVQIVNYGPAPNLEFINFITEALETNSFNVANSQELNEPIVEDKLYLVIDNEQVSSLLHEGCFRRICDLVTHAAHILWIILPCATEPQGSYSSVVRGFSRVARSENSRLRLVTIDVQNDPMSNIQVIISSVLHIATIMPLPRAMDSRIMELDYIVQNGTVQIPRLLPTNFGVLKQSNTAWSSESALNDSVPTDASPQFDEVVIDVKALGINTTGLCVGPNTTMSGCSGIITAIGTDLIPTFNIGDHVYAHSTTSVSSTVRIKGSLVVKLPDSSSFSVAASSISPFATAYFSLVETARVTPGKSALIHDAGNHVSIAAIRLCQHLGVNVIAAVKNEEERSQIASSTSIPTTRILVMGSSRFKQDVLRLTKGCGVDVVFSHDTLEEREKTLECIAPMATYLEIRSENSTKPYGPIFFPRGAGSFHMIDLESISSHRPGMLLNSLRSVVSLITDCILEPLDVAVLPVDSFDLETLTTQSWPLCGRVVLDFEHVESTRTDTPALHPEDGTYVIAGGLGSLGQQLCRHLAMIGVKNIAILTRRTLQPDKREALEKRLGREKACVKIFQCDICERTQVQQAKHRLATSMPPIRTVIQAAMLLKVRAIEKMTVNDFAATMRPKTIGTQNLLEAFQGVQLDVFLMLSSCVSVVGGEGQANYSAGNEYLDSIAQASPQGNTRFISLSFGMIEGTEHTSDMSSRQKLSRQGVGMVSLDEALQLIDYALSAQCARRGYKQLVLGLNPKVLPDWILSLATGNALFSHMLPTTESNSRSTKVESDDFIQQLQFVVDKRNTSCSIISKALAAKIASLASISAVHVNRDSHITDLGLDSLVTIQLRNWIRAKFEALLQPGDVFNAGTVASLASLVYDRSEMIKRLK